MTKVRPFSWGRDLVRPRREALGMTQAELAQKARLSPATITAVEAGRQAQRRTRERIARVLKLPVVLPPLDAKRREVLKEALDQYIAHRKDPSGLAKATHGPNAPINVIQAAVERIADETDTATALLDGLQAQADPTALTLDPAADLATLAAAQQGPAGS